MTITDLLLILEDISYKDWGFNLQDKDGSFNLQAILPDGRKSGKWYISPFISKSEFVQRCFLCATSAEEHETRLEFKYKGHSVFKPHYDVDDLVILSEKLEDKRSG